MSIHIINPPSTYPDVLARISNQNIVPRIWASDHTVWDPNPDEIANRLGWLHLPQTMGSQVDKIAHFVDDVRADGFTHVVLLGMGGSSLAPDMLRGIFGTQPGFLKLHVLDSTHPEVVRQVADDHADKKTLFIVATKSGTTSETLSLFQYFYQWVSDRGNTEDVGHHFIAITDPETPLAELAIKLCFRDVFLNNPNVGGRYSALSLFGLIPAALLGLDIDAFLREAQQMADQCSSAVPISDNPAAQLGALLGSCALQNRDKAIILLSQGIASLGDWIEQLIAESTGKMGTGILPVLESNTAPSRSFSDDCFFIAISLKDDPIQKSVMARLANQGHSIVQIRVDDTSALAGQLFLWEFATAIACHILGVHPFNQPNVESAKQLARSMIVQSRETGMPPQEDSHPPTINSITQFLSPLSPNDYVCIHAYLPPTDDLTEALQRLKISCQEHFNTTVTIGYGPRFLHSTGQLHKGDRGNGHFIQLLSAIMPTMAIPDAAGCADSTLSFGDLITAQALGDRQALMKNDRPVLTLSIREPHSTAIGNVASFFEAG